MTGQLSSTLHRHADELDPWHVDLDAVVQAGNRRVRRRRALVSGGAAAVLAVVGGAALLTGRGTTTAEPLPTDTTGGKPFSYAVGSVIHSGGDTVDVGFKVNSFVQLADGFVVSDPQKQVYVERDGHVQRIGELAAASTRIAVNDAGDMVGWWNGHDFEFWTPNRPDGASTTDVVDGVADNGPDPSVRAIADGYVWIGDARGTVVGILNDHETAIHAVHSLDGRQAVQDAGGGRLLVRASDGENAPGGLAVVPTSANPSTDSPLSEVPDIASGDLAPDGKHWFTQDADRFAVFDSQTGDRQDPTHPGFVFAAPYQWLDSDTIAAVALRTPESDTISLLTCHVSTNDCTVTAEDVGTYQDVAVPFGAPTGS